MSWNKQEMADIIISHLPNNSVVNLGIGQPTIIAERIPQTKNIVIHSENGVLGVKGRPLKSEVSPTLINAGKETIAVKPGASYFDSSLSFAMIRGGHIDVAVLGAMEVDSEGSIANWMIPGKKITGMGGAMDLVNGPKVVIAMMGHFNKQGELKLKKKCELPLTGKYVVNFVITELGFFEIKNNKFNLIKLALGHTLEDLKIPSNLLGT